MYLFWTPSEILDSSKVDLSDGDGSGPRFRLLNQTPPIKAAASNTMATIIIPAMGPPLREEPFLAVVETEGDPSLLPAELEIDAASEVGPVPVREIVVRAACETTVAVACEDEVVAVEETVEEVEMVSGVELGVVELELGAAVVEASGPSLAA